MNFNNFKNCRGMKKFRKCTQIEFHNNQHDINQGGKEKVRPNEQSVTSCKSTIYMGGG